MDKSKLEQALTLTPDSISQLEYVLIRSIAGGETTATISTSLDCEAADVQGIIDACNVRENLFDRAVALVRIDTLGGVADRDFGWDDLERLALIKIRGVVSKINDPDILTRVAVAANRAKRSRDPVPGVGNQTGININGPLVLAGGDLGTIRLNLSQRVAEQLSNPVAPTIDGKATRINSLEMLRLNDIRNVGEVEDAEEKKAVFEEKQKIRIDDDVMEKIFGT